jgi:hypothetical protein
VDSRIVILDGYEGPSSELPKHDETFTASSAVALSGRGSREWLACKVGRRVVVQPRVPLHAGEGGHCPGGSAEYFVEASSKKKAKTLAVAKFRAERAAKKAKYSHLGSFSADQAAAQRKFAAAAHACHSQIGKGGKNRSYLSCMRQKLKK